MTNKMVCNCGYDGWKVVKISSYSLETPTRHGVTKRYYDGVTYECVNCGRWKRRAELTKVLQIARSWNK